MRPADRATSSRGDSRKYPFQEVDPLFTEVAADAAVDVGVDVGGEVAADAIADIDSTIAFVEARIPKTDPLWGEIYNLKGVLLLGDGKNDGAIFYLRKGIELLKEYQDTSESTKSLNAC